MSKFPKRNLTDAMLQPGRQPAAGTGNVLPMGEMQMLLTLDQLRPNPDNPRTNRNPRYDEIKASIKARGLDSVPKVTRDPDSPDDAYIFSDGGNTRFAILSELWQETGDEKYWRINVVFKPWPGRLQCVIGHLAENEVRGDLTFIEKALGVHWARELYEDAHGKLSVRKFAQMLTADGMPLGASSVSRMMNTVDYLWPSMPVLLKSGMGRPQINALLALRQDALELWDEYGESCEAAQSFAEVFGSCCAKFDAPELWQPDVFRDELIGDCLKALPHPDLNYDRWLLALEPRKKAPENDTFSLPVMPAINPAEDRLLDVGGADETRSSPDLQLIEEQPDLYGGESVYSGNHPSLGEESVATGNTQRIEQKPTEQASAKTQSPPGIGSSGQSCDGDLFPPGTEKKPLSDSPALSMGEMVALDTDIEHLQSQVFRLAWAIADSQGCGEHIIPAREHVKAPGYRVADVTPAPVSLLLLFLTGEDLSSGSSNLNGSRGALLAPLLTGGPDEDESPALNDENTQRFMQLLMVMRHLRELQRDVQPDDEGSSSDENE